MSVKLTPSKRPYDQILTETNDRGKSQKSASLGSEKSPFIRVLCPISRLGSIIGEDGSAVPEICQVTGAQVRVEEAIPGCDERVVVILGLEDKNEAGSKQGEANVEETDTKDKNDEMAENDAEDGDSKLRREISSVQQALLCLFERMAKEDMEKDRGDEEGNDSSSLTVRLLIFSSQVNCLLGKGGSVLKHMSSESGAEIHILARDKLPPFASPSDDLVQISGKHGAVKKAIESISQQLLENSPLDQDPLPANASGPPSHPVGHRFSSQDSHSRSNHPFHGPRPPHSAGYHDSETGFPGQMSPKDALTFRLLCPDEKVGGVIGKGGSIIKTIQHETGCEIQVLEGVANSEDRIIAISGPAHPHDRISPPQDAVLRVQSRIFRALPESKDNTMLAKLLVSSNQIGCLLGKGGSIIAEMRKSTGAYIRILGKDQTPNCASENEEVVQIHGAFETVQEAIFQITSRLQEHFFRDVFPSFNRPSNPRFLDNMPPFPSYRGRREFSPMGMHSSMGPPFHQFDAVGGLPPPRGGFHPHDDRPPYMPSFHRSGVRPHVSERMPSSGPWGPQGLIDDGGPIGMPDYAAGPQRRIGGFVGGSPAIITSTKVEVVVPRSVVPEIYGEGGGCLRQICEISEAKVTINDPKPGATEAVIIIAGTPEQANAAQSLIQAFVMLEAEAP